jgi:hypothetical protein
MSYEVLWTQYGGSAVDITDQVDFTSVSLEQNASGINSLCRMDVFTLLPFGTGQYTKREFSVRDLIRVRDTALGGDAQWLFSGFVTSISPSQEGDHVVQSLELADYTSIFDVVVIDDMTVAERTSDVQVIAQIFAHVDGITSTPIWQMCALDHQPTATDIPYIRSTSQYVFSNPDTYLVERYQGMTVKQALESVISKTGYTYWVDEALNFHYAKSNVRDIMTNGSAVNNTAGWTAAPTGTALTRETSGGPFNSGTYLRFEVTGSPTGEQEVYVPTTVTGDYATTYMVTFRYRTSNNNSGEAKPQIHLHWVQSPSTTIHDTHLALEKAQTEWTTGWFMSTHTNSAPNTIRLSLTLGKSSSSGARQERIDITDIQVIPIDTTFGFLETGKSVANHGDADGFIWNDFENPSTTIEGADAKNAVRVYGAWENPTTHNLYNEYEHPRGVWAMRGRKIYANIFDQSVIDDIGSAYRAAGTFEKEGVPLRTVSFDHQTEHTSLRAGNVVPFIWETGDIAEPFIVRTNSATYEGTRFFWSSELGGDPTITQTRLYAVNVAVQNLQDYVTDAIAPQPPVSDPVTSAAPVLSAATAKIDNDGNAKSVVTVTWSPNTEPDLRSYRVDFAEADTAVDAANFTAPTQQIIPRNQSTGTGAPATITANYNAPSGKYVAARVVATDFMSNASLPSTAAAGASNAILAPLDTVPPNPPTNMLATSSIASVLISWDFDLTVTDNKDFSKFKLQRVSNSINSFPASAWADATLQTYLYEASSVVHPVTAQSESASSENSQYGRFYWYRVLAIDNSGNESTWAYANGDETPDSSDSVAAGKVNAVDIDSINAGKITSGSLTLTPLGATDEAIITNVSGSGTTVTYTADNSFSVSGTVTITGVDPVAYNLTNATVASATATQFTVTSNAIGAYVGGGVAYLRTSTAAIQSTNFSVSNSGSVIASDITLQNSATFDQSDGAVLNTLGLVKMKPQPVTVSGVTTNVGGASIQVLPDSSGLDYSLWTVTAISPASWAASGTVTTTVDISTKPLTIGVGSYISWHNCGITNGDSQDEAHRVTAVDRAAGTITTVMVYAGSRTLTSPSTLREYKNLTLVAPGGLFVSASSTSSTAPGIIGTGGLALGTTMNRLGTGSGGGYSIPADGELVFLTVPSGGPKYAGGGNLYQSATNTIRTSGSFAVGSALSVGGSATVTGNISGADLIADGAGVYIDATTDDGYSALYFRNLDNTTYGNIASNVSGVFTFSSGSAVNQAGNIRVNEIFPGDQTSQYVTYLNGGARTGFSNGTGVGIGISTSLVMLAGAFSQMPTPTTFAGLNATWESPGATGDPFRIRRASSSRRYKTNITDIDQNALDAIKRLRPVHYSGVRDEEIYGRRLGFIVEEMEEAGLDCVVIKEDGLAEGYDQMGVVAALLGWVRELESRVAELEAR